MLRERSLPTNRCTNVSNYTEIHVDHWNRAIALPMRNPVSNIRDLDSVPLILWELRQWSIPPVDRCRARMDHIEFRADEETHPTVEHEQRRCVHCYNRVEERGAATTVDDGRWEDANDDRLEYIESDRVESNRKRRWQGLNRVLGEGRRPKEGRVEERHMI